MSALRFIEVAVANELRRPEFKGGPQWTPQTWALALAGEAGEVAGAVLGKFEQGKPITLDDIGDEIADVVLYADLLAQRLGLSLEDVVRRKFNRVSERIGSSVRIGDGT